MIQLILLTALAAESRPQPEPPQPKPPQLFEISGLYTVWGLTQNNFLLGADATLDDAYYTVQMLRLGVRINQPHYGIVTRLDAAQGWWGTDNSPNTGASGGTDEEGNTTVDDTYNPDALFGAKDTNYALHVDWAYAWVDMPGGVPLQARVGRMPYYVGHRLVLDMDLDGIQLELAASDTVSVQAWWAKMSEGEGAYTLPSGALMSDSGPSADADLLGLVTDLVPGDQHVQVFALGYWDRSGTGTSYMPQGLGYYRARHQPNTTRLLALGVSSDLHLPVLVGTDIQAEADLLVGADDIDNTDHADGLLDINDGSLLGANGWLRVEQHLTGAVASGLAAGVGSGDADKTSGRGNVNKIQTMGFFPLTNVWEDSVMPDIAGISPQGLGSPVSRGYRELENTVAAQLFAALRPWDPLLISASGTWLRASTPISGFDDAGTPSGERSSDIGFEVDLNLEVSPYKRVLLAVLSGVFVPGEGAGLLINGTTAHLDPAWEAKVVGTAAF